MTERKMSQQQKVEYATQQLEGDGYQVVSNSGLLLSATSEGTDALRTIRVVGREIQEEADIPKLLIRWRFDDPQDVYLFCFFVHDGEPTDERWFIPAKRIQKEGLARSAEKEKVWYIYRSTLESYFPDCALHIVIGIDNANVANDLAQIDAGQHAPSVKSRLTKARLGQGRYRNMVLDMWDRKCAVTGVSLEPAVRASHIRPFMDCYNKDDLEACMDPYNGLPLVATLDALFDRCLITFDDDGNILTSSKICEADRGRMGLANLDGLSNRPSIHTRHYLAWHRKKFDVVASDGQ